MRRRSWISAPSSTRSGLITVMAQRRRSYVELTSMNSGRILVMAVAAIGMTASCGTTSVADPPSDPGVGGATTSSTSTSTTGASGGSTSSAGGSAGGGSSCPRNEVCCVKDKDCDLGEVCRFLPSYGCDAEPVCVSTSRFECDQGRWSDPDLASTACTCPKPGPRVALECGTHGYTKPVTYEHYCPPL
jgi:hypothetical protein